MTKRLFGLEPGLTHDEQRLINEGYELEVRNGEKYFCRREQVRRSLPRPTSPDQAESA
jgi:hypothetical protein